MSISESNSLILLILVADVTDVALEWAGKNIKNNPHISQLIEIRKVEIHEESPMEELHNDELVFCETKTELSGSTVRKEVDPLPSTSFDPHADAKKRYNGPPVLLGVVRDSEKFDFCMCNPPFFESMEEAGLNPKTSCGGTPEEMICPGGEKAFITRIIEDSAVLTHSFRYYPCLLKLFLLISHVSRYTLLENLDFFVGGTLQWLGENQTSNS
jgi:23S rRNA (adenine1618-N6)-methyltransferase